MVVDAQKLEILQVDKGMSVPELAAKTKLTVLTIYAIKKGRSVRVKTLNALAKGLGCKPSELLKTE